MEAQKSLESKSHPKDKENDRDSFILDFWWHWRVIILMQHYSETKTDRQPVGHNRRYRYTITQSPDLDRGVKLYRGGEECLLIYFFV